MDNRASEPRDAFALRDWLRQLKEASGSSYAEIARGIGEEERTVKRWMTGPNPSVPRGDALLRLLDFFGVTLSEPAPQAIAGSIAGELREIRNAITHGWSPVRVLSPNDADLWDEMNSNPDLSDEELAEKLGFESVDEMHGRRREMGRRIANDAETQAFVLERFAQLDRSGISGPGDRRLEVLEAKVDAMAQATAEALASLAVAIDELSGRLPQAKPGSRRRKAAGNE